MKLLKCEYFLDSFLLNPSIKKSFTGDFPVFVPGQYECSVFVVVIPVTATRVCEVHQQHYDGISCFSWNIRISWSETEEEKQI